MKNRLLPREKRWWTAFPLLPLALLLADPLLHPRGRWDMPLSAMGLVLFLVLLIWSLLAWDRARTGTLQLAGMVLIALTFAPFNSMVWLLFLTVICLTPWAPNGEVRGTVLLIALIVGLLVLETWLLHMPWRLAQSVAVYAVPNAVVSFMIRKHVNDVAILTRYQERDRIARDLHDVLGHTLSVIVLKSELAERLVTQNPQRATTELQDVERTARALLQTVRDTISGYLSSDLGQEFDQARGTLETAGLSVTSNFAQLQLPAQQAHVLSLALREAVTNIVRHARAKHCKLALSGTRYASLLTVEDDGTWQVGSSDGHGLRGMRERVSALGGTLHLTHEAGTQLRIELPLTPIVEHIA
jgi:two-component system sensor histidine kinase DesK